MGKESELFVNEVFASKSIEIVNKHFFMKQFVCSKIKKTIHTNEKSHFPLRNDFVSDNKNK